MARIRNGWDNFQQHLNMDTPPYPSDGDTVLHSEEAWTQAAIVFAQASTKPIRWTALGWPA